MRKIVLGWFLLMGMADFCAAEEVKIYPGAELDVKTTQEVAAMKANATPAMQKMMGTTRVYITKDTFDKVYDFYKAIYKETELNIKKTDQSMPDGRLFNDAFFCLDNSDSIAQSRHWMKIQNPFIEQSNVMQVTRGTSVEGVKDITVITMVEKE